MAVEDDQCLPVFQGIAVVPRLGYLLDREIEILHVDLRRLGGLLDPKVVRGEEAKSENRGRIAGRASENPPPGDRGHGFLPLLDPVPVYGYRSEEVRADDRGHPVSVLRLVRDEAPDGGMELPGLRGGDRYGLVGQVLPCLGGINQELEAPAARRLLELPDQLGVGLRSALRPEVGRRPPKEGQGEGHPRPAAPAPLTGHYLTLRAA